MRIFLWLLRKCAHDTPGTMGREVRMSERIAIIRGRIAALAVLPTLAAVAGGAVDEHRLAGFSAWRSACRAAGFSLPSVLSFTWQLLPNAILGALTGGLVVLVAGFLLRHRPGATRDCSAAHLGCLLAMPPGLAICSLALPAAVTLFAEMALALVLALLLLRLARPRPRHHP